MKFLLTFILSFPFLLNAQYVISGSVHSNVGEALIGANVYLPATYEGATVDTMGNFKFNASIDGSVLVMVQHIGYATDSIRITLNESMSVRFRLRPTISSLAEVVITAGAMDASDTRKTAVLSSIDVVTTGATGDLVEALSVLPGATPAGESGQLLVRGGAASETQAFINGLRVPNFYTATIPNVPSRSRFSPFDFSGITFASGGFSAEYGDALSAALILQTQNMPEQDKLSLGLMTIGGNLGYTKKMRNQAVSLAGNFTDLSAYKFLNDKAKNSLVEAPRSQEIQGGYWWNTKHDATLKVYAKGNRSTFGSQDTAYIAQYGGEKLGINNHNFYGQAVYQQPIKNTGFWELGFAQSYDQTDFQVNDFHKILTGNTQQVRAKLMGQHREFFRWKTGLVFENQREKLDIINAEKIRVGSTNRHSLAGYFELDYYVNKKWLLRGGIRADSYEWQNPALAPRLQVNHIFAPGHQLAFSAGRYQQRDVPQDAYAQEVKLAPARADHLLLTYFKSANNRLLRLEGYYKKYNQLTTTNNESIGNTGTGFARGIDLFYRDRQSIKNGDLWVSLSLIDSKRQWRETTETAPVPFSAPRVVSVVYKHFFPKISMGVGLTYRWHNGRPYQNPNEPGFYQKRSPHYHDLSANITYLTNIRDHFTVIFISMTNVPDFDQVHTYRYDGTPNSEGVYQRNEVRSLFPRFPFVGMFIDFGKRNNNIGVKDL